MLNLLFVDLIHGIRELKPAHENQVKEENEIELREEHVQEEQDENKGMEDKEGKNKENGPETWLISPEIKTKGKFMFFRVIFMIIYIISLVIGLSRRWFKSKILIT